MKILSLHIDGFGKFHDRDISFEDGLNVVYGKNEAGKSTLHTFIKGMLFGIERQRGRFTMEDVVDGVVKKLIFRHPHVFGGAEPEKDAQSVLVSWDAIKRREKHQRTTTQAMDSVARSLPALGRKSSRKRPQTMASTGRISRGPCPSWTRRWASCTRRCRTAPTWPRSWGTCCLPP